MEAAGRFPKYALGPAILAGFCALYFLHPNPRLDFSAFDTRDSESYLALSWNLVTGQGYTRSLNPQFYIPHSTWPPGLPILLAPLTFFAGVPINLLVLKLGLIAYGVAGLVLAYLYAGRLTRSPLTRLAVPLLLGLDPYYWLFSRMANCEMPTVLWSLVALLLADICWARGTISHKAALSCGLICGFGMLIRGSFFGALFLPLVYLLVLRPEPVDVTRMASRYLLYAAGFVLPFACWMIRNSRIDTREIGPDGNNQLAMIFRTSPVDPTSPFRSVGQILSDVLANLEGSVAYHIPKALVPGLWSPQVWSDLGTWSWPVAAVLSIVFLALSFLSAKNLPVIVMYGSMAALNVVYAAGGMARLWVPVTCLLALSVPIGLEALPFPRRGWFAPSCAGLALTALAASLVAFAGEHDRHPYHDANFAALAHFFSDIRARDGLAGNVLTPNPQAFELLTGLSAPMSIPRIGVDPRYDYVILPSAEWRIQSLRGTVLAQNGVWSLVALPSAMTLGEFRERYDCERSTIAAFAMISNCLIQ